MSEITLELLATRVQRFVDRNQLDDVPRMWEDDAAVALVHFLRGLPRDEWPVLVDRFKAVASEFLTDETRQNELVLVGRLTLGWLENPAGFEAYKAETRREAPYLGCV